MNNPANETTVSAMMSADANHPRVKVLLEKLMTAIEDIPDLEITEGGAEYTLQGPQPADDSPRNEFEFKFCAAANPDTDDWRMDQWIARGVAIAQGKKPKRAPNRPGEGPRVIERTFKGGAKTARPKGKATDGANESTQ